MTEVRSARPTDLARLVEIYNYYVTETHVTFDTESFKVDARRAWYAQFDGDRYRCLVIEVDGSVRGYASSAQFKPKSGYLSSVEVSVYLEPTATGRGFGQLLYEQLFSELAETDLHRAYAGIALPNDASITLHRSFGFREVARFTEVGRKFGRYWDVVWMERPLRS